MRNRFQKMFGLLAVACLFCESVYAADFEATAYRRVTLPVPAGVRLEVSGLAQMDDGRLGVATRNGEVWLVSNPSSDSPTNITYKLFASGLHEPLGLAWRDGAFYTAQRSEITRLRDTNGDSVADEYDAAAKGWGVSGNYHEYVYGPVFDHAGRMWITLNSTLGKGLVPRRSWRGWAVAFGSDGKLQPMSAGLRSPSGIGVSADGAVFTTDQQGNWVPTCSLLHLQPGVFFGHADSLNPDVAVEAPLRAKDVPNEVMLAEARQRMPSFRLPAAWFPYRKMGQSTTDVVSDNTGGKFGPFTGQLFVGEFVQACIFRVFLEKVRGEYQGACFPFRKGFQSAVVRLAFAKDGSLFVGENNRGWNSLGDRSYGLERLAWSGEVPFEVLEMRALRDGFELVFTRPIDLASARAVGALKLSSYTYVLHEKYGSEEMDTRELPVRVAGVSPDARRVRLQVDGLRETFVHELQLPGIRSPSGEPLLHPAAYYTLNRIPE